MIDELDVEICIVCGYNEDALRTIDGVCPSCRNEFKRLVVLYAAFLMVEARV
jgi:NMD protein affecting ribosome stability and mRNA decay